MRIQRLFEMKIPLLERWLYQRDSLFEREKEDPNSISSHPADDRTSHNCNEYNEPVVLFPKTVMQNNMETASGIPPISPSSSALVSQTVDYYVTNRSGCHPNELNYSTHSEQICSSNQPHHHAFISNEEALILKGDESITRWFNISSLQKEFLLQESINPKLFSVLYSQLVHFSSCPSGCSVSLLDGEFISSYC